jgi:hypothetical protein
MPDRTLYDTTVPSVGSLALAHERILRVRIGGTWVNITGDANNINPVPTGVRVNRENYGQKAASSSQKIADNYVVTFTVEGIRGANGMFVAAQAAIRELLKIGRRKGDANLVEAQWFDALDDDIPAFQGKFSVEWTDTNTGFADGAAWSFTLTSDGTVAQITSPIATTLPIIETALPSGKTVGDVIYVRGYKLTGTTGITVDGATVLEFQVIDDNTVALLIPATVAGAAPNIVTAHKEGRNLVLVMEGLDPFVVKPLPARAGVQITDTYLKSLGSDQTRGEFTDALVMAVDGARENAITGRWEPLPDDEQPNWTRMGRELSQEEIEGIVMPAFFWQTVLGMSGVQAYLSGGEGLAGTLKASTALSSRLGLLARTTSPSSESASETP